VVRPLLDLLGVPRQAFYPYLNLVFATGPRRKCA
jgi:hypothetical protein